FALCAGGISVFMIGFVLYREADLLIDYRVPVRMIAWLLLNRWPLVLLDVMPGAGLFAVILSLGRMARERELQVIRLSGWSLPRIVWPLFVFALAVSYGLFLWNEHVVPASERRYAAAWTELTRQKVYDFVVTRKFVTGPDNTRFYIGSIDRRTGEMRDVMVFQETPEGYPRFMTAASGRIDGQIWTLRNGVLHELGRDGYVSYEVGFAEMTVNTKQDWTFLFTEVLSQTAMTRAELRKMALALEHESHSARGTSTASSYWLNYHLKVATPFTFFVFTALALPFACLGSRAGRLMVFLPALLLYFTYFLLLTVLYSLGSQGLVPPLLAAWGSNIFFGALAVALLLILVR
ncbi:MAG: LptF/LptG family permease, partial [Firmicutes bacterium]|nr:LptF/LptG family permease [Bacillota bacterium]